MTRSAIFWVAPHGSCYQDPGSGLSSVALQVVETWTDETILAATNPRPPPHCWS